MKKIKVLELFGGIGAIRLALEKTDINYEIVDYVEIDKYAVNSYNAMFDEKYEPQDVSVWNKNLEVDLLMHGSPCQDFSIASNQLGGDENSGTRSSLLWESLRIIKKLRPNVVVWENVSNVLSEKHKKTFYNYIYELSKEHYVTKYQLLNSKDFGVAQNRNRIFVVSIRVDYIAAPLVTFNFPKSIPLKKTIKDYLEENNEIDKKYFLTEKQINYALKTKYRNSSIDTIKTKNDILQTLKTCQGGSTHPKISVAIRKREFTGLKNISSCLLASNYKDPHLIYNNLKIRKITPKEAWRLMGIDDIYFDRAKNAGISDTQLYKQAGNSIVTTVLIAILESLRKQNFI